MPKLSHLVLFISGCILASCGVQSEFTATNELPPVATDSGSVYTAGRIDDFLHSLSPQSFNGAVVVEKQGKLILGEGYGYALDNQKLPFTSKTISNTAQLARQFTAAAILKLEAKQLLTLEDTLARFFDNIPGEKRNIKLIHLLQNTSGLPLEFPVPENVRSKEAFLDAVWKEPLISLPGKEYHYSNVAYRLLAAVVEAASGQDYEAFLRQELFIPAGMYNTGYVLPDFQQLTHATSHEQEEEQELLYLQYKKNPRHQWHLKGNSGMLSNSEDLFRWTQLLTQGTILPADARGIMWQVPAALPGKSSAFGWAQSEGFTGAPVLYHQSKEDGFLCQLFFLPKEKISVVLLANQVNGQVENLGEQLAKIVVFPTFIPAPLPYTDQKLVRLPQEGEARHVRALLAFIQEGGSSVAKNLLKQNFSPGFRMKMPDHEHIDALDKLRKGLETATLERAEQNLPFYMFTFYSPEGGLWYRLRVKVEPEQSFQISSISVETTDALN